MLFRSPESKPSQNRSASLFPRMTRENGNAGRTWNGKPMSPMPRVGLMYVPRKLEEIHQQLDLLAAQGKTSGFPANAESAQTIGGIVEDICQAMMDHQVRALTCSSLLSWPTNVPDFIATRYL